MAFRGGEKRHLKDLATAAGVSLATVDRVLNGRKGVNPRTRRHVLDVARRESFLTAAEADDLGRASPANIAILLPAGTNPYLRELGDRVRARIASARATDPTLRCFFIDSFQADALAASLRHHSAWADGIAFFGIDHPTVREAAAEVQAGGTRLVTLISGLQQMQDLQCVGVDSFAAGRTAGMLIARLTRTDKGAVALVAGSRHYLAHAEREDGFRSALKDMAAQLTVVGLHEGHDDAGANYRYTLGLLDRHPDLRGIYNVGGSSSGIARALAERNRRDVILIGHGLSADTRRALMDGTMDVVFDLDIDVLLDRAIDCLLRPDRPPRPPKLDIFFRENMGCRTAASRTCAK